MSKLAAKNWSWQRCFTHPDSDLTHSEKLVAFVLQTYLNNQTDSCWPGVDTIAARASLSRSSVKRALHGLSEKEWLDVVAPGDFVHGEVNEHKTNLYLTDIPPWFVLKHGLFDERTRRMCAEWMALMGVQGEPGGGSGWTPRGFTVDPELIRELPSELKPLPSNGNGSHQEKKTRKPDPIWDALLDAGWPSPSNEGEAGRRRRAVKLLKQSNATPEEILRRTKKLKQKDWEDASEMALATHWSELHGAPAAPAAVYHQPARLPDHRPAAPMPQELREQIANLGRMPSE